MQRLLGMERSYYSFDQGRWHFVVVDNIHRTTPGRHIGYVDEEQLAWLREDLSRNRERPTMVAMHVPPLTAAGFLTDRPDRVLDENQWEIGFDRLSRNPRELLDTLSVANVRAILSGHIHLLERLDPMGHTFLNLRPDGTFDWSYQTYGWQAPPEAVAAQGE